MSPMTDHDPMCQQPYRQRATCRDCQLIARVRADERERMRAQVEALPYDLRRPQVVLALLGGESDG